MSRLSFGHDDPEQPSYILRITPSVDRIQEHAVEPPVKPPRGFAVRVRIRGGMHGRQVMRNPHFRQLSSGGPDGLHGKPMRQEKMVDGLKRSHGVRQARRMDPQEMAQETMYRRLVVRDPVRDAIAQTLDNNGRIVGKLLADVAIGPAARVLQRLRQVPMEKRGIWGDVLFEERIHKAVIEVQARLVHGAHALGNNPRPGDGKAVGVQAQPRHEVHVFLIAVVVVYRNVARRAVANLPGVCTNVSQIERSAASSFKHLQFGTTPLRTQNESVRKSQKTAFRIFIDSCATVTRRIHNDGCPT